MLQQSCLLAVALTVASTLHAAPQTGPAQPAKPTPAPVAMPAKPTPTPVAMPAKPTPAPVAKPEPSATPAPVAPDKSGIVLVEQAGRVVALGSVLQGDGRIVTSMSRLTPGQLFVRYANGSLEPARVGHSDATRDLALLVPKTARWQKGLKAGGQLPAGGAKLTGFALNANRALTANEQALQGLAEVNGHPVLKLGQLPKANELGAPLLDEHGDTAAVVVSGCSAGVTCTQPPVALPVSEVKAFLRERPASAGFQLPRLGLAGQAADTGVVRGLSLTSVEPQSPAASLNLRAGADPTQADLLVALAGTPVATEAALRTELSRHASGDRVDLLIYGKDGYRMVPVRLGASVASAVSSPVAPAKAAPVPAAASPKAP